MSEQLFAHINKFVTVSNEDFQRINSFFESQSVSKKQILMEAGSPCDQNYFVLRGCLHMYFTSEKGVERTVQFAIDNWWMTDGLAYLNQTRTDFNIQAVEDTELLSISYEKQEQLLKEFPQLERYFRIMYQIGYGSSIMKMKYLFDFSKEEIYFHFTEHFPEFAQRVPQYLIASFLGLTPEYVSEIRAKKRS
ncbi:Crp/Fnr family transcriptional regulator [Muricauda sp. CAU 1633]|uniref:Crp/Fnr family transcriptional regulator n=1 Tax=Allomuricauda sp. CAU 1633 TaxID=2816036 RepID=UPI001A8F9B7C|nr:Crp/Fnr family transcriptional regulator [Muricauda sp. CAU 1633]MBO0322424.1 Crp/Fnr family transcriptional regulator [Muricauda sp. CAU 1633]